MKNKVIALNLTIIIFAFLFSTQILAASENDLVVYSGIELDNLITLTSSVLSIILFALTYMAYKRSRKNKLVYIAIAFLLFSIKGFLISSDIFFQNKGSWVDPVANLLDFVILLSFFFGMIKK